MTFTSITHEDKVYTLNMEDYACEFSSESDLRVKVRFYDRSTHMVDYLDLKDVPNDILNKMLIEVCSKAVCFDDIKSEFRRCDERLR